MTTPEALAIAREIGQDIAAKGRHPASVAWWARSYSWWRDVVDTIGTAAATEAATSAAYAEAGRERPESIEEIRP